MQWLRAAAVAAFAIASLVGQDKGKAITPPQEAQDALRETVNKIARSYKLLNQSKKDWGYKMVSAERGKIDPAVWGNDRREVFCVLIDPMIPTFTDWKIGNFVVYREQGALWVAEESDKDNFLRLSCKNFKNPGDAK